jgi:hypothetical protein
MLVVILNNVIAHSAGKYPVRKQSPPLLFSRGGIYRRDLNIYMRLLRRAKALLANNRPEMIFA